MRIAHRPAVQSSSAPAAASRPFAPPSSHPLLLLGYLALAVLLFLHPEPAFAQLEKGTTALQKFKDWLWLIIPICATMIGGLIGLAYASDLVRKDTAIQWGVGVVFAGAIAGGFIKYFWG
ncbi:TrbC/VirB2 family protein [Achromobacter mucicolens]|uniref:TrbC/VirB2 family protein n=1 Tax=Achromobacter mucicolens TaxID=1389922 RepID=UPI002449FE1F|nr:TrbC/VirB2 family protein [Achromobacter mucicolens]MDH0090886.1 TrbC/VirB2 family protein [Achromobacter mucicolens]